MLYVAAVLALVATGAGALAIRRRRQRDAWARIVTRLWEDRPGPGSQG